MPWCHCIVSRFSVFSSSAAKKEVVRERSGSLHVEFACCLWNLYVFPQSKAMLVRITGYFKLAVNVNVNTNCCMLLYSICKLSRICTTLCFMTNGIDHSTTAILNWTRRKQWLYIFIYPASKLCRSLSEQASLGFTTTTSARPYQKTQEPK